MRVGDTVTVLRSGSETDGDREGRKGDERVTCDGRRTDGAGRMADGNPQNGPGWLVTVVVCLLVDVDWR